MSKVEVIDRADVSMSSSPGDTVIVADFEVEVIHVAEQGPPGPMGPESTTPGPPGPMGPQGYPGTDGNTILYGARDPAPEDGTNGDSWINTSTSRLFGPKAGGVWPAGVSLIGPQGPVGAKGDKGDKGDQGIQGIQGVPGADGNTILYGPSDPLSGVGINGNFYINTATHFMFGPKAGGAWPAGTSLIGPQGPVGPAGPVPEAPTDGQQYGRQSSAWSPIVPATGAVRYDTVQALTVAQQLQARQNIFAAPFDAEAINGLQLNGAFEIIQERGLAIDPIINTAKYICDVWQVHAAHPTMTLQAGQASTAIVAPLYRALPKGITITATPAGASMAAGDYAMLMHHIEGQRLARLNWGSAGALPMTLAFWAYSNTVVGTATFSVRNLGQTRCYLAPFNISATGVWEYKTITIPGCPDGAWQTDTGLGAYLSWTFAAGSSYQDATANAWNANGKFAHTTQSNFFSSTGAGVQITGVMVLPGSQAPDSERQPLIVRAYPQDIGLTQRMLRTHKWSIEGYCGGAQHRVTTVSAMPPMRVTPSTSRLTTGSFTNIRGSDPANFCVCSGTTSDGITTSIESAAAGYTQANNFVDILSARY